MKFSIEICRNMSAARLGFKHKPEVIAKMGGVDRRGFPPRCIKCPSRDVKMCMKYNTKCFDAKEILCFKKSYRREVHKDYVKQ